jgi:hypothetical protein
VVTSGDGGWVHFGFDVVGFLVSDGYFVVGFDAKVYLSAFTTGSEALSVDDVLCDYAALVDYAAKGGTGRPVLVGVSEGAGLSVLAATAPAVQPCIAGVVALGLPDRNELGWRWRDSIIYLTRKTPDEPTFSARELAARVSPVPLAAIHSTRDEIVPLPEYRTSWPEPPAQTALGGRGEEPPLQRQPARAAASLGGRSRGRGPRGRRSPEAARPLVGAALFCRRPRGPARELRAASTIELSAALRGLPAGGALLTLALTTLNYLVLAGYDLLTVEYAGVHLRRGRVTLTGFLSYAISNSLGFGMLSGAAVRFRSYTR